jgi:DNA-binding transcriptional LysR family regulator
VTIGYSDEEYGESMDRYALMRCFVRVAERGSFSAVASELGLTQSSVSKQIAALERQLGARLLHRSTHELCLTEEGETFLRRARDILDAVEEAESELRSRRAEPHGWLKVSCPLSFGELQIVPRLRALQERHPRLTIELQMSDAYVDLVREGADLAIRIGTLSDSSLIARPLGSTMRAVVGTPDYFERNGTPAAPDVLGSHNCLVYTRATNCEEWPFQSGEHLQNIRIQGGLRVDSYAGLRAAVLAGIGVALAPTWLFPQELKTGAVQAVLREYASPPLPIHAVYPSRRYTSPKLRAFIDFFREEFELDPMTSSYWSDEE